MKEERGLVFPFKELVDECDAFGDYASEVLDKTSTDALQIAKSTLQSLQSSKRTDSLPWSIDAASPLKTIWSDGESQRGKKNEPRLRAEFSFVWEIRKLNEGEFRNGKHFLLDGLASTVVTIKQEKDGEEFVTARWAAEVGDHQSPGAHFHYQIKGEDSRFFPKALDIPRLPAALMSPFLAMELVLGELFQRRAERWASSDKKEINRWRALHAGRLLRFFDWQRSCIADGGGSPWMVLKLARPPRNLPLGQT
jgi:hypothetical protein